MELSLPKIARWGSFYFLLISLLRAVRAPNLWSATQASWDYSAGFIKRGLFGELLSFISPMMHYTSFYFLSFAILAAELALLLTVCWRMARRHPQTAMVLATVFFSPAMLLHIHTVGYLDHLLLPLLVAVACVPLRRAWLLVVLCLFGMLVHELFLVLAVPILLSRFVLLGKAPWRVAGWWGLPVVAGLMLVLFSWFSFAPSATMSADALGEFTEHLKQKTDFPLRLDNLQVLQAGLQENTSQNIGNPVTMARAKIILSKNLPVFLPFLVLMAGWAAWQAYASVQSRWRVVVVAAVPFLPCLSMLVAWDYERILALSVWVGFVQLLVIPMQRTLNERLFVPMITVVLLCGLFLKPTLMDGYAVQRFSYIDHWMYLYDVVQGNEQFPRIPSR